MWLPLASPWTARGEKRALGLSAHSSTGGPEVTAFTNLFSGAVSWAHPYYQVVNLAPGYAGAPGPSVSGSWALGLNSTGITSGCPG